MRGIIIIGIINALLSAFLQVGLYERFKKKFVIFFVPLAHALPITFLIAFPLSLGGAFLVGSVAILFSMPAVIGSLFTGVVIVIVIVLSGIP